MSNVERLTTTFSVQNTVGDNSTTLNFNQKVLGYIKQHRPNEKLNEILNHLSALSPGKPATMQQLYTSLLSADEQLRKDEEYQKYTHNTLDNLTFRMIGLNMFYNNMMYKRFTQSDEANTL
ncbi:TPA: hypothetical protein ACHUB4_004240 [Escherichia coli]|uniref:hypothetical protein n=1 Tax=Escherichia coli TaxID=562 RepID=UPI000BE43100|nr:hypothetical protein [Escherichia coli]MBS9316453.1 hypothetical protein [Escherichia coli]MEB5957498.1 hypothetical protein [Escherichia coli]